MRSKTGYAEFGYFHCYLKMDPPRALGFRPLVKENEALGTRLVPDTKFVSATNVARAQTGKHYSTSALFLITHRPSLHAHGNNAKHYVSLTDYQIAQLK